MTDAIVDDRQLELDETSRDPIVRYSELKSEYGIPFSRQHLNLLESRGKFPKRVRLSERVIGWRRSKLLAFLAQLDRE